jgi:uncharacterized protein YciI
MMRFSWLRCFVWSMAALSVNQTTIARSATEKKAPPEVATTYWIFLTTGKSSQGTERSEIEKLQAAHLANFGRLHKAGKLFTAGPLVDPQKKMRGIVVVKAPDLKSLSELFEPDPFVKNGFLNIDAIKMEVAVGKFQETANPKALAEYRLVLLEKPTPDGKELDAEAQKNNRAYCQTIHDAERLCFAGWLSDDELSRRGILIFHKLDDATLKSLVDELPAVKSKTWKATTIPLYMSEGIVK